MHQVRAITIIHYSLDEEFAETPDLWEIVSKNRAQVIEASLAVEVSIANILIEFFIRDGDSTMCDTFEGLIIGADFCSFAAKLKILLGLVRMFGLIDGKELNDFESSIRKVMTYRNAFAHGHVLYGSAGSTPVLAYFKDRPQRQELTDSYLEGVEEELVQALGRVGKLRDVMIEKEIIQSK